VLVKYAGWLDMSNSLLQRGLTALICAFATSISLAEEARPLRFETDVRRVLKAHCWQCHGEEPELKGKLDTRLVRFLLKGGKSGAAIVPGNRSESLLFEKVSNGDMPPEKKKLSSEEIELLGRWIDQGARTVRPEPATVTAEDSFSDEEKSHWAFQPIRRPPLPPINQPHRIGAPIDAFLLARLEAKGLTFGPEAGRETLIRRVYFDLLGLPPTPDAINQFRADTSPNAYERLVDNLLASPAYGERWARHWLDIAGYADSDGYNEKDTVRPWAFHYRDYVIRSLNSDKPWDQFIVEQLAGDELVSPPHKKLSERDAERLIATGFLRMGPDGTGLGASNNDVGRNAVVAETIKIMSTSLLGLSVGCAQCHEHRYDPVTQADYYRLRALIEPAYDTQKWRQPNARLVSLWSEREQLQAKAVIDEVQRLGRQRATQLDALAQKFFEDNLAKLPADQRPEARKIRATPAVKLSVEQKRLLQKHPFLTVDGKTIAKIAPKEGQAIQKKWDEEIKTAKARGPAVNNAMTLAENPGRIPVTRLFFRGDPKQPRQAIEPGELSVLNAAGWKIPANNSEAPTSGRRLAYARHLTNGQHPLVARVLVNRFWLHHFGQGLVATPADFGATGEQPSHPDLLDWLADDFMANGWSLKQLHRRILSSTAYRQSSKRRPESDALDPDNRLLGRMSVRRLEAEVLRDSLLALGGKLTPRMHGAPTPVSPDLLGQIILAVDTRDGAARPTGKFVPLGADEFRRSIYVQVRRSMPLSLIAPFDPPALAPNCERRPSSNTPAQALVMMNNPFVARQAKSLAARILREAGADRADRFRRAWLNITGREPAREQSERGLAFLESEIALLAKDPKPPSDPDLAALTRLCQALLSSNEFLYVE
jgi:hypothetical protein